MVTITVPRHAARYLVKLLKHHRGNFAPDSYRDLLIQEVGYDSFHELECSIPNDVWEECNE